MNFPWPLEKRIEKWVERVPFSGCWVWMGTLNEKGYGQIVVDYRTRLAHRVVYEHAGRKIAAGLNLCHRCDVRSCVNPDHLFPATQLENIRDCIAKGRFNSRKRDRTKINTHCKRGHEFKWFDKHGHRHCRVCHDMNRTARRIAAQARKD